MNQFIKNGVYILTSINNKKHVIWIASTVLLIAVCVLCCALYVSDYYRADLDAIEAFTASSSVSRTVLPDETIVYGEADSEVGFIFYPGGKVEYTAYEPLMVALASRGVLCVLVKMPFNLAVLDMNAAEGIPEKYPDVDGWFIGGHSLGGSMAASYAAEHSEEFRGVVLLASYSTADLTQSSLDVLSIFGSEDGVMNREKYDEYKKNLPSDLTEIEIAGGCHAYFGMYGEQKGDKEPALSAEEQIIKAADYIAEFVFWGER